MPAESRTGQVRRGAADRADRLVKRLFDSVAQLPAPDHLVGLAHELDSRLGRTRVA